jgi:SpoVK/Ycf46/Vps4 family AAA+-type ATPase
MARSDLLVSLVRSGSAGDQVGFRRAAEAIIAEEHAKQHGVLASQLSEALKEERPRRIGPAADVGSSSLVFEIDPRRRLDDLVLPDSVREAVAEIIEEHHRVDLLRSFGLEPRHRLMLVGPPGSGKTSLAEVIATETMVPLLVARYEALITSYLGETSGRLDALFEGVRARPCVLFFDEFDTIAKERGDIHETGEIKRVVSSLLLQIDRLPHYVIVVVATNHPELLDRAVWRRFQTRLGLPDATRAGIVSFLDRWVKHTGVGLGYAHRTLADKLHGASYAEVEEFVQTVQRRLVLAGPDANERSVAKACLDQWTSQVEHLT